MYPLTILECVKNQTLRFDGPERLLKYGTAPKKLAYLVALSSAYLIPKLNIGESVHRYRDIFDFLKSPNFWKVLKWPWSCQKLTNVKNGHNKSWHMPQGVLCPNLTKKFQKEVSQIVDYKLPIATTIGGLSVNLNHLKIKVISHKVPFLPKKFKVIFRQVPYHPKNFKVICHKVPYGCTSQKNSK